MPSPARVSDPERSAAPAPSYVLPLKWSDVSQLVGLVGYLEELRHHVQEIIVIDGSTPAVYETIDQELPPRVVHARPDPERRGANGKVSGVLTGLDRASSDFVVIADDDVRWRGSELERASGLLAHAEAVRPQNFFWPLVWHTRWDTARSLINRVWSGESDLGPGDFPGTLAVRAGFLRRCGGYDGDSLFENLELMRTVLAHGGRVLTPLDLYVRRLPPSTRHFLSQRVPQAYDDFAIPRRMATWLALLPIGLALGSRRRWGTLGAAAVAATGIAEAGRRRAGGSEYFPVSAALLAPAWLAERAVCSWLAVRDLFRGGVVYGGSRLKRSARSVAEIRTLAKSPST